ncbi:MAG: hypothetical protein AAF961_10535, partial [Planctomycetota bacterium]
NVCPGAEDEIIALVTRRPRLGKLALRLEERRLDRNPHKVVESVSKNWTAADRKLVLCDPQRYRKLIETLRETLRCGPCGLLRDIRLLGSGWGFQICQISGVPVSIWQGGCDRIVTPSMGRYFHRAIAGSELTIDPKAGHVTMFKWHAHEILAQFGGFRGDPDAASM